MFTEPLKHKIIELSKDKRGNFAMIAAVVAPLLLAGGGLAIDLANQAALKTRFQAASDSVSLAVATRIANGTTTVAEAENFGTLLLNAQMANDYSRFSNLTIEPVVEVTEVINGGISTWDVKVGGTATQDTTPFAAFLNKETTSATVASIAQSGNEEIQGALSMAVIIDVSGSMGTELESSSSSSSSASSSLVTELNISSSNVSKALEKIYDVVDLYSLTLDNVEWIVENYTYNECKNLNSSGKLTLLGGIGLSTSYKGKAKTICKNVTWAENKGASQDDLLDNIEAVYIASVASAPVTRLDALKSASTELFSQFETADPTHTYVRTGVVSYHSYLDDYSDMEWGTSSADEFVQDTDDGGGTASTNAFKWAYDELKSSNATETNAHSAKNGQTPDRFILFMTDGNNNNSSDDTSTKSYCDDAKDDGITVYSVAFDAPSGGQALLEYCATSSSHYYDPETAEELITAFENIGTASAKTLTRLTN